MKDFATSLVTVAPSPANSGTSLTVQTGHGARFPTTPFYATVHPALLMPDLDNAEKVQVTAIVGDVLTIVRALGDTTAKTVSIGYRISNTLFADDIASLNTVDSVNGKVGTVVLDSDDIAAGATNKYVTTAEKTKLSNLSGTNTGDQDLSGLVPNTRTVNGHALSSNVTVSKSDVGLSNVDNTSDASKPVSTATQTALNAKADSSSLTSHTSNTSNPHSVTKTQVGLGNADNTSDTNKPVSTATQMALNLKANTSSLATIATTGAYSDLTGKPTIPAQFNPIAGTNMAITGTYPNMTFDASGSGGTPDWGDIGGTLSDQTDLQGALDDKFPYTGTTSDIDLNLKDILNAANVHGTEFYADNYYMTPGDSELYVGAGLSNENPGGIVHINAGNGSDDGSIANGDINLRVGDNTTQVTSGLVRMISPQFGLGATFDLSNTGSVRNILLPSEDINLHDVSLISGKADDGNVVHITGDQSIDGIKTFTSSPIVPTPSSGTDAANKDYVDAGVGGGISEELAIAYAIAL